MDIPNNTAADIVDGEPIDIVARVVHAEQFEDGNELYYLKDKADDRTELKIWAAETDQYDIETYEWYLFRNAVGDVFRGDRKLSSNRGALEVLDLDGPPEPIDLPAESALNFGELTDGGIVAVDIETISTVSETELDLENSDHVELLCIGVGYAPGPGLPGTSHVLFRDGTSADSEVTLLERFCEYVESRNPEQLLLFKGEFDVIHLTGRSDRVASDTSLESRVGDLFERYEVVNLTLPGRLEDNVDEPVETQWDIYDQPLHPAAWRAEHPRYSGDFSDPTVTNKDIPYFGKRYLELCEEGSPTRERRALRELIRHYTTADIEPLFELASRE